MCPGCAWIAFGFALTVLLGACGESPAERDEREWRVAEKAFQEGSDSSAHRLWTALDRDARRGREAHRQLVLADEHYRRAIELFRANQPGVREAMQEGLALGPIDPVHYLTLARLCAERGNTVRAVDFYRKYLGQAPAPSDAPVVRIELANLAGGADPFPPLFSEERRVSESSQPTRARTWALGLLVLPVSLVLLLRLRNGRRRLHVLLASRPEWHQSAAYHLGCLRHELLKHRMGPLGEPLRAIAAGKASAVESQFLHDRLSRGAQLLSAWRAQLDALERSLGIPWKLDAADPMFRKARRALGRLACKRWPPSLGQASRMLTAHASLMAFDRQLSQLIAGLVRCRVDENLLREIVASARSEWALAKVELDELRIGPVPEAVEVDVLRTDLRIVLRNIVRNAIQAVAEAQVPRRLAVDVRVDLELTGEEFVVFRVRDSSPHGPSMSEQKGNDVGHGLGIVATALRRYDGSMQVVPDDGGFAKAVLVRFFHSQRISGQGGAT